jgi:hypothetical protein
VNSPVLPVGTSRECGRDEAVDLLAADCPQSTSEPSAVNGV